MQEASNLTAQAPVLVVDESIEDAGFAMKGHHIVIGNRSRDECTVPSTKSSFSTHFSIPGGRVTTPRLDRVLEKKFQSKNVSDC